MFDWLWSWLASWGFFKKSAALLLLGLDNAGKTTLLHKLKFGSVHHFVPTHRPKLEEIDVGSVKFRTWDMGGHRAARRLWEEFYMEVDAIVFVVDSTDRERFPEAQEELHGLLNDPNLQDTPFLILGNKIDDEEACSRDELMKVLDIYSHINATEGREIQLFMCSVVEGAGIEDSFRWLGDQL